MYIIEQTVEPQNGFIDLHMDVPAEWNGYVLKVTVERTESKIVGSKSIGLRRFRGKWAHLSLEQRLTMQKELDDMHDEWERPIL